MGWSDWTFSGRKVVCREALFLGQTTIGQRQVSKTRQRPPIPYGRIVAISEKRRF